MSFNQSTYINNLASHGIHQDFETDLNFAKYSYFPLFDSCLINDFDAPVNPENLVNTWSSWFAESMASKDYSSANNPGLKQVIKNPKLHPVYELFQHEIRAHRMPLVYSSLGTLIAQRQHLANLYFQHLLKERKEKGKHSSKTLEILVFIENQINNIFDSLSYVLESLAIFRDIIILHYLSTEMSNDKFMTTALKFQKEFEQLTIKDKRFAPYNIGLKMALTIYQKLGFWGVEAGVGYALNPLLNKKDLSNLRFSPFLRYNQITQIPEDSIPKTLDIDDPMEIDSFIIKACKWAGYETTRNKAVSLITKEYPELVEMGIPSKDFFIPADQKDVEITVIPELIFCCYKNERSILVRKSDSTTENIFMNYMYTLLRMRIQDILENGTIKMNRCPFLIFYNTRKMCMSRTEGKACDLMQKFCDNHDLKFSPCTS